MKSKRLFALTLVLGAISALPAETLADPLTSESPLPPGKPAGAKAAQIDSNSIIFISAGILIAVVGFYISTKPYQLAGQSSGGAIGSAGPVTTSP